MSDKAQNSSAPAPWLKVLARREGFDLAQIASVSEDWAAKDHLRLFIERGHHGQMDWLQDTFTRRSHPRELWPLARSALVVGQNYGPDSDPLDLVAQTEFANISVYARGRDYHELMKGRLKRIGQEFARKTGAEVKVFVDTAPIMEKPLAQKAGLGWAGKHTNLVARNWGSWLFLGVMLTDLDLPADVPETDHCGACTACLDICPTKAFPAPYQLDARRCIAYLTIEHQGPIPREFREAIGNRVFGCDDCLAICPWNKFAQKTAEIRFHSPEHRRALPWRDLLALDDAGFRALFQGSPVRRLGYCRFLRNVLIGVGNSGLSDLVEGVLARLDDENALIRGAAIWALRKLDPHRFAAERSRRSPSETEPQLQAEWEG